MKGVFVLTIIVVEFWKGTRARARIEEEGYPTALIHLVRRNRRRWGGYVVHVGIVIMFMGFAGSSYQREVRQSMEPGDTVSIASPFGHEYTLMYQGISTSVTPQAREATALFFVTKDGQDIGTITAERELVMTNNPPQPISTVGVRSTLVEDLYVILATVEDGLLLGSNDPDLQRATFQVLVNPLVPWIWYGGLIIAAGTLIGLWPGAGVPTRRSAALGSGSQQGAAEPPSSPGGVPATVG